MKMKQKHMFLGREDNEDLKQKEKKKFFFMVKHESFWFYFYLYSLLINFLF